MASMSYFFLSSVLETDVLGRGLFLIDLVTVLEIERPECIIIYQSIIIVILIKFQYVQLCD